MDRTELNRLLDELRMAGADHSAVEAKRAGTALPRNLWETLSAFANTDGGTILLGVDEAGGVFDVVGVDDPAAVGQELQSLCAELGPALRPRISVVDHDGAAVIVAELAPVARTSRPCHLRAQGPYASYIRVGDADQRLTQAEVDEMRAASSLHDHSRRPAPPDASLDPDAAAAFCARVRSTSERSASLNDDTILRTWAIAEDGHPTLAGVLALGEAPAAVSPAARVAYRRLPAAGAADGVRHTGTHLEGRVGELLEDALARLRRDLNTVQVERGGSVYDDLDVPEIALREIIGNALLHRSLTEAQETASIAIEVSDEAVVVTSPGGLHGLTDPALLGLDSISGVRNLTLVRVCEQLTTPSGARIVENQASGIITADRECRARGTMPPLFLDLPARFQAVLLRGALDTEAATQLLTERGVEPIPDAVRLVSVARRLRQMVEETPLSGLNRVTLDARLAARALAPSTVEDAAALLRRLEDAGVFERRHTRHATFWVPTTAAAEPEEQVPEPTTSRRDRVPDLVIAIADTETGQLSSSELGRALGLSSSRSINRWIARAAEAELIEATTESPFDPNRAYRLTRKGRVLAERLR